MSVTDASNEKLDIGRVIQLAVETGKRQFGRLAALWGITIGGIILLVVVFAVAAGGSVLPMIVSGQTPSVEMFQRLWPIIGVGILAAMVFGAVLQAASLSAAISDMSGRPTSLEDNLRLGLSKAVPLIVVSILFSLAFFFGMILLIVPGIMIALALSQCLSVVAFEKVGIMQTFDRSRFLTRNNRWRLFGLWAVIGLSYMVLSIVLAALTGGFSRSDVGLGGGLVAFAANMIESLLASVAGYCLQAATYAELRRIKDGVGAADLGAVFD